MDSFASRPRTLPPERSLISIALVAGALVFSLGFAGPSSGTASVSAADSVSDAAAHGPAVKDAAHGPAVSHPTYGPAVKFDKSPPLRLITPPPPKVGEPREVPLHRLDILKRRARPSPNTEDPLARKT